MNTPSNSSSHHAMRVVSVLALGTLIGVACNSSTAATSTDNTGSSNTSGNETTVSDADAGAGAATSTNVAASVSDASVAVRANNPYAMPEQNGQPCTVPAASENQPMGACFCQGPAPGAAGRWQCHVPVAGPLAPPELA